MKKRAKTKKKPPDWVKVEGNKVRINPNHIRTRIILNNKTVLHPDRKKAENRRKCRKKIKDNQI